MHLTVPSNWSRSIGTGGRDGSERLDAIVVMRTNSRIYELLPWASPPNNHSKTWPENSAYIASGIERTEVNFAAKSQARPASDCARSNLCRFAS
jgi:hypothetical protein